MKRSVPLLLALPLLLLVATASRAQSAVDERALIAAASALDAAIDAKDWESARELLLDEITVALPGEEPGTMAADALVARWRESLHAAKTTFHLRGSERVTFDGADSAVLRSKAHVLTHVEDMNGDDLHELWADYHHELDRTENGWRVRHYGLVPRLERGNAGVIDNRLAPPPAAETPADDAEAADAEAADGKAVAGEGEPADEAPADGDDAGPATEEKAIGDAGGAAPPSDEKRPANGG